MKKSDCGRGCACADGTLDPVPFGDLPSDDAWRKMQKTSHCRLVELPTLAERMDDMKIRFWMMGLTMFLALAFSVTATTYYINDDSTVGDVYCTQLGNDANDGRTPATPKLTLNNLFASTSLLPGDVVLIDTGTYTNNVVIGTSVVGATGNPVVFQGSTATRPWGGGTTFSPANANAFEIRGHYLELRDIRVVGGTYGFYLFSAQNNEMKRIASVDNSAYCVRLEGASNSNAFRNCAFKSYNSAPFFAFTPAKGNYIEHSVLMSDLAGTVAGQPGTISNVVSCILVGQSGLSSDMFMADAGSYNIIYSYGLTHGTYETLAELQRINTNWHHNTVAEPKFVNAAGGDFHLVSAAGFVSNGVWVTNATAGFSPGIDFGPRE